MRHLDHIVWPTRTLSTLADTFRRLGFSVGRRNRHSWGTENHVVQFDGMFIELLGFADDAQPVLPDDSAYPFAAFCADYLTRSAGGAAMLVLRSEDAHGDAADFEARGFGAGRLLNFSRTAQGADGSDRMVAFTIAFAALPGLPEIGAFTCQHHRPENFWNPAAQHHANGALGVSAVVVETPRVDQAVGALRGFIAQHDAGAPEDTHLLLSNSRLEIVAARIGDAPTIERSRLAALHVPVDDLAPLAGFLDAAALPYRRETDRLYVPAAVTGGTCLAFTSVGQGEPSRASIVC